MQGKRGIVFGVANDRSYAWYISKQLLANGAECAFTYLPVGKMQRRVEKAVKELGVNDPWLMPCDASKDEDLDALFAKVGEDFGNIDFVVHSIAFADRAFLEIGSFHKTTREAWAQALDISGYTLLAMAQRALPLMPNGGSIVALTYYVGEKVIPGYNIMGVAKAALEHTARYLAFELGENNIRVNLISGGPLKTLAASAVGGIDQMFEHQRRKAALRRENTGDEVGDAALYLLSDAASGITGETIHVDAGFSVVGL